MADSSETEPKITTSEETTQNADTESSSASEVDSSSKESKDDMNLNDEKIQPDQKGVESEKEPTTDGDVVTKAVEDSGTSVEGEENKPSALKDKTNQKQTEQKPSGKKQGKKKKSKAKASSKKGDDKEFHLPLEGFFLHGSKFRKPRLFAKGEIVAGRVIAIHEGALAVDLFGKATAFIDLNEPKEIVPTPIVSIPANEPDSSEELQGTSTANDEHNESEIDQQGANQQSEVTNLQQVSITPESISGSSEEKSLQGQPTESNTDKNLETTLANKGESTLVETQPEVDVDTTPLAQNLPQEGAVLRGRVGYIAESGHLALINGNVNKEEVAKKFASTHEAKETMDGLVYGFNRGGFEVLFDGVRGFCPVRGISLKTIEDPESFLGKKIPFLISNKKKNGKMIVTRRPIIEKHAIELATERLDEINEGETISGKVTEIKDFGFFVDLGKDVEGLVHQTEISWEFGKKTTDLVHPGKEVEVKILKIEKPSKKEKFGRVSLSLKALQPDPWEEHAELIGRGTAQKGKVIRTTDFGAFIELAKGVEGLLHISELGRNLTHANQALEDGAEISVVVENVDRKNRKISFSKLSDFEAKLIAEQKEGEEAPAPPRSLKPGSHVIVVIQRTEHKGAFLQVKGVLGKRGRAYIDGRDIIQKGDKESQKLSPGTELEVKIVSQGRDGTLKCSMRARQLDEERSAVKAYKKEASKQGMGTFADLLKDKFNDLSK